MTTKPVKLYHDPRSDQPDLCVQYIHCHRCLQEIPGDVSPKDWARLSVGIRRDGSVQITCVRHGCNVDIMSTQPANGLTYGKKVAAKPKRPALKKTGTKVKPSKERAKR